MNSGANVACGDTLLFLHADNELPVGCIESIREALKDHRVVGGCCRVRIPNKQWIYRIHDGLAHYVGKILRVRCGDHGIFVRRSVFNEVGGYPDVPLMEDVKLFRAIQSKGRVAWLPDRLLLSSRRHEQVGVYRYTFICAAMIALYCLGVSSHRLSRTYEWLIPSRQSRRHRPLMPVEDAIFADFRGGLD
jgi:hypothetical protein